MTPEFVNKWRIFPRLLLAAFVYLWAESTMWFMSIPEPNTAQGVFISAVWGALALFANFYFSTGGKDA